MRFDAIVLAGAPSHRLGVDKALVRIGAKTLLERAVDAADQADRVVVVGPVRGVVSNVIWTEEEPPGGGPAAALAAGLEHVRAEVVVVLATDLPSIDRATVASLTSSLESADAAVLVDDHGRDQMLAGAYRGDVLRTRLADLDPVGVPLRALMKGLHTVRVPGGRAARDADTWEEINLARSATEEQGGDRAG